MLGKKSTQGLHTKVCTPPDTQNKGSFKIGRNYVSGPMARTKSVLIIGDGNFSYSLSFCRKWQKQHWKIITTSFEDEATVKSNRESYENIKELHNIAVHVCYGIDGTNLEAYLEMQGKKFDCIIFNFPHTGGKSNIKRNRDLIQGFLGSAYDFLTPSGEIRITLCRGQGGTPLDCSERGYKNSWKIIELAAEAHLILSDLQPFRLSDWPGYTPTGYRGLDKGFLLNDALTHIFTKPQVDQGSWNFNVSSRPFALSLCNYCNDTPVTSCEATPPHYLSCYECFEYPILDQIWHPVTRIRNQLVTSLSDILSPCCNVTILPHPRQPFVHMSPDCLHNVITAHLKITLPSMYKEGFLESSLQDRILSLLTLIPETDKVKTSVFILSSPVYGHTPISTCTKDQPITHQLMCLVINIDNQCIDLKATAIKCITKYLNIRDTDLSWKSHDHFTIEVLQLEQEDKTIQVASLSPVTIATISDRSKDSKTHLNKETIVLTPGGPCSPEVEVITYYYQYLIVELEEIALVKHGLPDPRIFWTKDQRFSQQFLLSDHTTYQPFSLYPPQYIHDVSFWVKDTGELESILKDKVEYQLFPVIREIAGLSIASTQCIDIYKPSEGQSHYGQVSLCYRLMYCSLDRGLGHSEVLQLQQRVRDAIQDLRWELR